MATEIWDPGPEALTAEVAAYRGGWLDQMAPRAATATLRFTTAFVLEYGWRVFGLMLLGMALYRWGFFTAMRTRAEYALLIAMGGFIGLPIVLWGVAENIAAGWEFAYSFPFGSQYNYWSSLLVSGGFIGIVMLVCLSGVLPRLTRALAAVGRTALSNYLLQTALCTLVFYGFGLGLFGSFDRVQQLAVVFGVWAIELVLSPLWLKHYRFGPLEWLWRSLTYMEPQPFQVR